MYHWASTTSILTVGPFFCFCLFDIGLRVCLHILSLHAAHCYFSVSEFNAGCLNEVGKDQENPNFSAFDTFGSLSNDPVFDPGRLGKLSDGTKITKIVCKTRS